MDLWKKWQDTFDLEVQFDEVQKEYEEYYEYKVAKGQERINILLIIIYVVSIFFSALTLLVDAKALILDGAFAKWMTGILCAGTLVAYPMYRTCLAVMNRLRQRARKRTS